MEGIRNRLKKEKEITDIKERNFSKQFLSTNPKTGISLNFPLINCQPTKNCSKYCYASYGPISSNNSIVKTIGIHNAILKKPELTAKKIESEIRFSKHPLRISGTGEIIPEYKPFIEALLNLNIRFFGYTKRK